MKKLRISSFEGTATATATTATARTKTKTFCSSTDSELQQNRQEKRFVLCHKCHGGGKLPSRNKKSKIKDEQMKKQLLEQQQQNGENNNHQTIARAMKNCNTCSGTGILPLLPSSTLTSPTSVPLPNSQSASSQNDNGNTNNNTMHVSIVGGGIGGLALAVALQHRSIPFTLYEKDFHFDERKQGYGLTMQQGSKALLSLGLYDYQSEKQSLLFGMGIHSKRHLVHQPDGTLLGEWGMKIWGRPKSKQHKDAKRQNAHIARQELRRLLYNEIIDKESCIKWGHKLVSYDNELYGNNNTDSSKRNVSLTFEKRRASNDNNNGDAKHHRDFVTYRSSVLVGADGIRSAVRKQKIGDDVSPLRYLGCIVILGITSSPASSTLTSDNETVFQTADGTTRMYAMPFSRKGHETAGAALYSNVNGDTESMAYENNGESGAEKECRGETMWQLSFPMTEDDAKTLSSKGPAALKEEAMKRCKTWHNPIPEMLSSTPDELVSGYPVYDREIVDEKIFRNGSSSFTNSDEQIGNKGAETAFSTLIGDAAHPMSPFKGQGANQALLDAILLARALHKIFRQQNDERRSRVKKNTTVEEVLLEFERDMLKRSSGKVKASAEAARFLHSEGKNIFNIPIVSGREMQY